MGTDEHNFDDFVDKLQNEIYPFIHSLSDISTQHLNFVTDILRQSASASLYRDSDKLIQLVRKLGQMQTSLENARREVLVAENSLVVRPSANIEFHFETNWSNRLSSLSRYCTAMKALEENKSNQDALYRLSEEV
jgi:hypothetical protein